MALVKFANGSAGTFEATRFGIGCKNQNVFQIHGAGGMLRFNLERLNHLEFLDATEPSTEQGPRDLLVTDMKHPIFGNFWRPGHIIGYEHTFIAALGEFLDCLSRGEEFHPNFEDALVRSRRSTRSSSRRERGSGRHRRRADIPTKAAHDSSQHRERRSTSADAASAPPAFPPRNRWTIVGLLSASITINLLDRQVLSVLASELRAQFQWSNAQYGYIAVAFNARHDVRADSGRLAHGSGRHEARACPRSSSPGR